MVEISVNLATHNRAAFLEGCLISLCEQTLDPARYEICVVNNACTDNTPQVVEKIAARYPRHRVFSVDEPKPGLSRARNCGLRATTGALVANADDDGTVGPDWLEIFVARFAELGPDTAIVGGDIEPVWEIPKPDWLTHEMELYLSAATRLGKQPRFLDDDEPASEGNSCLRRSALAQAGNYPEELGRVGSSLLSGEHIVESLIRKNGGKVFYDPRLVLRHFIHANRLTPQWFRNRLFWQGVSEAVSRDYQIRHNLPLPANVAINLPLRPEDWKFVNNDMPDNLAVDMAHFRGLGFILAHTGILPVER